MKTSCWIKRGRRTIGPPSVLGLLLLGSGALVRTTAAEADDAAQETRPLYTGAQTPSQRPAPWSMKLEERTGGPNGSRYLYLNGDWQALPWAGVSFRYNTGATWQLTPEWIANGFVRFQVNGGLNRYGNPTGPLALQLRPDCEGIRFQHIESRFVDRGRGIDEDPATWQEVLVPLRFWESLKPGMTVRGVAIQCVGRPSRSFGLADVEFVRFDHLPAWITEAENTNVAQPWVTWPTYAQLPDALKADRHPPQIRDGRFVGPDGRCVFVLNAWLSEDSRLDLWGHVDGPPPPDHGLFDPAKHGWIYNDLPNREALCRLGFNSLAVNVAAKPFWDAVGYSAQTPVDPSRLPETVRRVGLPFYLDNTCFEWTLGAPAQHPQATALPADVFTQGPNHWVPYRIIGAGHDVWLKMWRLTAQRYHDAGAHVLMFELFNEPAYRDFGIAHRREFADWLKQRYGSLDAMNSAWRSHNASWDEAVAFESANDLRQTPGRSLDYDDYLSGRFTDLVSDGIATVNAVLPDALVGVQPMGGYALQPRDAIWEQRLVPRESVVVTPTGGGSWSAGAGASQPSDSLMNYPMAGAPIEDDLLLALAGSKMIFDDETYLHGQTALDTRNRLWQQVVAGLDGLTIFSWSKRGWNWWGDRQAVVNEADRFPYSSLIPLARRTDALRGINDFAAEIQPLADRILPKPWGPAPRIGLLYSWPQARRIAVEPDLRDKTSYYHAALRYSHWNAALIPSDRALSSNGLDGIDVLITGGIHIVEPQMPARLEAWVQQGGVLIVGEEEMGEDLYGRPLDTAQRLGVHFGAWEGARDTTLKMPATPLTDAIRGSISHLPNLRAVDVTAGVPLISTADGKPVVVRRTMGRGYIYAIAADLADYSLAKVLSAVLEDAARQRGDSQAPDSWRAVECRTLEGGLAPNVLVSRRSYPNHHAILLLNGDDYRKTVRLKVPGLTGQWNASEALSHTPLTAKNGWYEITLEPDAPAVLLLEKAAA